LAEGTLFFQLWLLQEGLVFQVLNDKLHSNLLLWVSELIKEEGRFEPEGLPAVP